MSKMVSVASVIALLAVALATQPAEARPGAGARAGGIHGPGLAGGGGGPATRLKQGHGPQTLQGHAPGGGSFQAQRQSFGNGSNNSPTFTNNAANTATGTATGTYAGGNAATVSGNTVSGNTTGSNNAVNVYGNQATATANNPSGHAVPAPAYVSPYPAPIVIAPGGTSSGATQGSTSATATAATCPAGTALQSTTVTSSGQTTVVCVATK